jgi:hypothetical protein
MIVELFPTSAGASPSKLMYREEASSTLIVDLMFEHTRTRNLFNTDYQLIVDLFLNPNCEGACTDVASATICNKSIKLIDVLSSEGDFSVPANFGNIESEGARAPLTTFVTLHNRKSKYNVTSHFSKTFLHFSKDFAIFCEGDWENVNNKNDSKEY